VSARPPWATATPSINAEAEVWDLSWNNIETAKADVIEAFFAAQGGYRYFNWTAPRDVSPKKWTCEEWNRTIVTGAFDTLTARLERVYDL
jgi:phage-related protein